MVCYYMAVEDNHMSKEITKYDVELGKRLEKIRKNHGLRQLDMANIMETDIGMYKRYAYAVRKVPAEKIAILADELQLDLNYVVYGRDTSTYDFVRFVGTAGFNEIAKMFQEVSRVCREKGKRLEELKENTPDKEKPSKGKSRTKKTDE